MTDAPWYRRARRWGQTNLTEVDPADYDAAFWRDHWKRTRVQGVIVNAGGIVAYYPSRQPLQYRARHLGDRDLLGDIVAEARRAGLAVLARMDSNRATASFYEAHRDWFCADRDGNPFRSGDRFVACVNGPYYRSYLPDVLREVIERCHPDGFTDNSWAGPGRAGICACPSCRDGFREAAGHDLPASPDWADPVYRRWIRWSFDCRLANWDLNNRVTREAGGPHCLWLGMLNANPVGTQGALVDLRRVAERSEIIMCDHQGRDALNGFEQNALNGKLLHGLLGWGKVIPESMAMYVRGERAFRKASSPPAEARTWMVCGLAGGISPWWHHIGAAHEDRRQFCTAEPVMRWHEENEGALYDRTPVAGVGLVWSQDNTEFYGRDDRRERVALPWRGFTRALTRARIPYLPVHADHVARDAAGLDVLILPDLAAMSDAQVDAVRRFVRAGGSLVATGRTSLLDEWGEPRGDFALADVLGVHLHDAPEPAGPDGGGDRADAHTYLRIEERHEVFAGFAETAILPFGGRLQGVRAGAARVLATLIPPFPIYPPEFAWMRQPRTDLPTLLVRETPSGARAVTFAADIDRCYARQHLPDHGDLLANAVRWACRGRLPVTVEGPGYLDCSLYRQEDRLILHIVNLSGRTAWPTYAEDALPVGPLRVEVRLPEGVAPGTAERRVRGGSVPVSVAGGRAHFTLDTVDDHEMVVIG